ncbi:hypothetical protein EDB19DRAFT_1972723 [Suillus lakei]|nr:hypothetical protein EDB19DRAFT_1972723 [Suillus lakei]
MAHFQAGHKGSLCSILLENAYGCASDVDLEKKTAYGGVSDVCDVPTPWYRAHRWDPKCSHYTSIYAKCHCIWFWFECSFIVVSKASSIKQQSTCGPQATNESGPSQPSALQNTQQPIPQPTHSSSTRAVQPAAPNAAPLTAQPAAVPPAPAQPQAIPAPADEIAVLRARIAKLEHGNAHGNHFPARAPMPQRALVADPAEIDRIRANLAGAKDEPKQLVLPALQPGHKVSALSLPIPLKVEEAFKNYCYVPYTALTHAARSKAFLHGEDSSFIFTQDGLTAKGLDRANELSIMTVDWIAAAKAAEDRTLHYWGEARASALVSHHLIVLDIGRTHGWAVAMHYDVQQRELAHANHEHNLAGLDVAALTIANNKIPPVAPQSTLTQLNLSSTPPNHAQPDPTALYDLVMHIIPYGPHLSPTSFSPPTPPSQPLQPHCVHCHASVFELWNTDDVFPHLHDNDNILIDRAAYGVTVGGASKGLRIWVILMGGAVVNILAAALQRLF